MRERDSKLQSFSKDRLDKESTKTNVTDVSMTEDVNIIIDTTGTFITNCSVPARHAFAGK